MVLGLSRAFVIPRDHGGVVQVMVGVEWSMEGRAVRTSSQLTIAPTAPMRTASNAALAFCPWF